jgi:Uma2 family endonuclease
MTTILKLTPKDHGRRVTPEEWETAKGHSKRWKYEIIDGVIQVTPPPAYSHDVVLNWLHRLFVLYEVAHPDVVNHISQAFAVRVPGRTDLTEPQPDFGLYYLPESDVPPQEVRWHEMEPFLVVEVISEDTEEKDTVRNVELYAQVPGIREYWIIDPHPNAYQPSLTVYRKRGSRWQKPIEVAFGEVYETPRLLPGFSLTVDPRAR